MVKIKSNCIIPSSAFSIPNSLIKQYDDSIKKPPEIGDLVFGEVSNLGHHRQIESRSGRMHTINIGTRAVFVFANRYAPDQFEGLVPDSLEEHIDLYSRGGVVGEVKVQNQLIGVATKVRVLGYVCDAEGKVINTFADGIFQRETAALLQMPGVRERIHKLIFCAPDSTAVFGGIQILKDQFDLTPDAISGLCSSSPLAVREIQGFSDLPILQSMEKDFQKIFNIIG